ncbi:DHA1 family bicyclomycin/chloramphenicol resistance-like MFS transporter [Georgenia soli]|uniref:DHA1 family bicyclomycin/chloramphenicol resistance-like MFS transporter n=1 Tax=Georgenia soli TaxID=638953 RepID=A0A2A9EQT7_9MICO|nr:multidrug effflux MFS transporter [Georgenia soli]PFG40620.1 DHA1 family bicyclomycin/chloramphenicol resistance-like MFS transporter [Georgenia soli]
MTFPASARPRASFVLLLGAMAALPAVTTDLYLPSLPVVAEDLSSGPALVQATITGVLIGGAIGQLLIGPLSDRYGRRRPVMIGVSLHVVASVLCALTPGIWPLIVLRVIQGIGNAAATVTAMAVIRDRYSGAGASVLMSRLMLVIGVAPLLAPTVGGLIAGWWGWRATFVVLALVGLVLIPVMARFLPETLPPAARRREPLGATFAGYGQLLRDGHFMALAVLPGLGLAALMSYVAGSPFVLQEGYGLSETEFALLFALNGAGLVLGSQLNASLVKRFEPTAVLGVAIPLAATLGVVLLALVATGTGGLLGLIVPLWLLLSVNSLVLPNATALALTLHGERAGTAAALIGALQAGVAGVVSPVVGLLGGDDVAMATVILGAVSASLVIFLAAGRTRGPRAA